MTEQHHLLSLGTKSQQHLFKVESRLQQGNTHNAAQDKERLKWQLSEDRT